MREQISWKHKTIIFWNVLWSFGEIITKWLDWKGPETKLSLKNWNAKHCFHVQNLVNSSEWWKFLGSFLNFKLWVLELVLNCLQRMSVNVLDKPTCLFINIMYFFFKINSFVLVISIPLVFWIFCFDSYFVFAKFKMLIHVLLICLAASLVKTTPVSSTTPNVSTPLPLNVSTPTLLDTLHKQALDRQNAIIEQGQNISLAITSTLLRPVHYFNNLVSHYASSLPSIFAANGAGKIWLFVFFFSI